ncbi:MAG: acyl-CoA dehydratase activase-related protein [Dehalococcoidales bacterium]|nr:acyl-CoA dehydratase activase-related protein [Dehalococcoidales bacterium]
MTCKVGIPRALLYYKYFPMWRAFLEKLGAEIVVSENTNQKLISQGASLVVSDTCLPVKVFIGHVLSLSDKCDKLLIPVVRSTAEKVYNCSRFLALPDLAKAVVPGVPPILEIEFDYSRGTGYLYRQIYSLGKNFTLNPFKIKEAAEYAWETHRRYHDITVQHHLTRIEAIDLLHNDKMLEIKESKNDGLTIGIAGHPYVLHDEQVSHNLIKRLRADGITVLTPEMAPEAPDSNGNGHTQFAGLAKNYWESEEDVVGAGDYYTRIKVDGIIGIMAFACGPDSMMMNLVQRQARSANIPFMSLTVEEHTAEAGVVTRLEAFLDMIHRAKRRNEQCV